MRRLGVYGESLPTRKSRTIAPADFLVGGIVGQFERKYTKAFLVKSPAEKQDIFGGDISSSWYGSEAVDGFFSNAVGIDAKLYIKSYVGCNASTGAIDAVVATININDTQSAPATVLTCKAAYQYKAGGALEYGISGNRTGITIKNGDRFTTAVAVDGAGAFTDTFILVNSASDVYAGDVLKIVATGGTPATIYLPVASVDTTVVAGVSYARINFSTVVSASAYVKVGDAISVRGFQLRTWRRDTKGVITEVDKDLGKIWCTYVSTVTNYFVDNVFSTSKWIDVTTQTLTLGVETVEKGMPADSGTIPSAGVPVVPVFPLTTYTPAGVLGADGTAPSTAISWNASLTAFDTLPIRFICLPETTTQSIQQSIETYCRGRVLKDNPKVIYNIATNQTKAQLITIGNNFQRSDDVLGIMVADALQIQDPFATSTLAPYRVIPNCGHIMGLILRTIGTKGIHYIPQKDTPIFGIQGLYNSNISTISDDDRTDLASAGVNVIQFITGYGYVLRNAFTPSISLEFQFLNAIVMREYIKISAVDSLQVSENQPNNIARIQQDRDAVISFGYNLWLRGSTGNVPTGETFGQTLQSDNITPTTFQDHFETIADLTNNPQSSINAGNRNIDVYFTWASPAGSIRVGVGLWLK